MELVVLDTVLVFISDREDDKVRDGGISASVMFSNLLQLSARQIQLCVKPVTSSHDEPLALTAVVGQYSLVTADVRDKKSG